MPVQGTAWHAALAGPGYLPPGLCAERRRDPQGRTVCRSCPHVRFCPAKTGDQRPGSVDEGAVVPQTPTGVPANPIRQLGTAFLGPREPFNHQRCHHRKHRTSVLPQFLQMCLTSRIGDMFSILFRRRGVAHRVQDLQPATGGFHYCRKKHPSPFPEPAVRPRMQYLPATT